MRILFTGGGTMGPVTPLLAVAQELIDYKESTPSQMHWIGTRGGPEKEFIQFRRIHFSSIQSGKLRRYFSIKNFSDPFFLMIGIIQAMNIIRRFKPDIIFGAGGYVQVPVIWAGWLMKKKTVILQLDVVPGLANLMCASMADAILLSFPEQKKDFPQKKTIVTGLPIRKEIAESTKCSDAQKKKLGLDPSVPTVFIAGGGTGSRALNDLIISALPELVKQYNIVHLTGKSKDIQRPELRKESARYQQFEFLSEKYADYASACDIAITRGGMAGPSEFACLGKPMIIIPIPHGHQEKNAEYFESKGSALWRDQNKYTAKKLMNDLESLLKPARYTAMQKAQSSIISHDSTQRIITALHSLL